MKIFDDESIIEQEDALIQNKNGKTCGFVLTINTDAGQIEVILEKKQLLEAIKFLNKEYPEFNQL